MRSLFVHEMIIHARVDKRNLFDLNALFLLVYDAEISIASRNAIE